jgi:hypothetical protein
VRKSDLQEKENPSGTLAGDFEGSEIATLPKRLYRYSKAKDRALQMVLFLGLQDEDFSKELKSISSCGDWLHFRHYYEHDAVRLYKANFCKKPLLCPLCAIRKAQKQLEAYLGRFYAIVEPWGNLKASEVVFTIKNGPDLGERFDHLRNCVKSLLNRRRIFLDRGVGSSEWNKVQGGVFCYEVTTSARPGRDNQNKWHPHTHCLIVHQDELDEQALISEWKSISKDSDQVKVCPAQHPDEPFMDFQHVFKYALKFPSLSLPDNLQAYRVLKGRRLLQSFGCFRGVQVPENLEDKEILNSPFIDLFYKYLAGVGYSFHRYGNYLGH